MQARSLTSVPVSADARLCPGCRGNQQTKFFELANSPVDCGSVSRDPSEARNAKMGRIELHYCHGCGLIFNHAYDVGKIRFQPGYEVALTHSKTFINFQKEVADRLINSYDLHNREILEIGCGDGAFLKRICNLGGNHGVGIDPTVPFVGRKKLQNGSYELIREFFGEKHGKWIRDFVCSLSMFEDIRESLQFLIMLRGLIGNKTPGIYFEVFNGFRAIEANEIWSIHYEQCNYFSLDSLERVFRKAGFKIVNSGGCYEDEQYLFIEAVARKSNLESHSVQPVDSTSVPYIVSSFRELYLDKLNYWKDRLEEFRSTGRRVVLWGSGGKGISFLNGINAGSEIKFVVDINPNRQGCYIPGTAQPIVPPEKLVEFQPQLIILTNPIYEREIRQQANQLGLNCEFDLICQ